MPNIECIDNLDILPYPELIKFLSGTYSELQTQKLKKTGKITADKKRLLLTGAGLTGMNRLDEGAPEWSNYFNHTLLVARTSTTLAKLISNKQPGVNPAHCLNLALAIHVGKRSLVEGGLYENSPLNFTTYKSQDDISISNRMIQDLDIPIEVKQLADHWRGIRPFEDLDHTTELMIVEYADVCVDQQISTLADRLCRQFIDRFVLPDAKKTINMADCLKKFREIVAKVRSDYNGDLDGSLKQFIAEIESAFKGQYRGDLDPQYSLTYILRGNILLIDWEKQLLAYDIDPYSLDKIAADIPDWEADLRKSHIVPLATEAIGEYEKLMKDPEKLQKKFPAGTWWGDEIKKLYETDKTLQDQKKNFSKFTGT